jgi:hypothetical protein
LLLPFGIIATIGRLLFGLLCLQLPGQLVACKLRLDLRLLLGRALLGAHLALGLNGLEGHLIVV